MSCIQETAPLSELIGAISRMQEIHIFCVEEMLTILREIYRKCLRFFKDLIRLYINLLLLITRIFKKVQINFSQDRGNLSLYTRAGVQLPEVAMPMEDLSQYDPGLLLNGT